MSIFKIAKVALKLTATTPTSISQFLHNSNRYGVNRFFCSEVEEKPQRFAVIKEAFSKVRGGYRRGVGVIKRPFNSETESHPSTLNSVIEPFQDDLRRKIWMALAAMLAVTQVGSAIYMNWKGNTYEDKEELAKRWEYTPQERQQLYTDMRNTAQQSPFNILKYWAVLIRGSVSPDPTVRSESLLSIATLIEREILIDHVNQLPLSKILQMAVADAKSDPFKVSVMAPAALISRIAVACRDKPELLLNNGGMQAIKAILQRDDPASHFARVQAAVALYNLSLCDEGKRQLIKLGIVEDLMSFVLKTQTEREQCKSLTRGIIGNLLSGDSVDASGIQQMPLYSMSTSYKREVDDQLSTFFSELEDSQKQQIVKEAPEVRETFVEQLKITSTPLFVTLVNSIPLALLWGSVRWAIRTRKQGSVLRTLSLRVPITVLGAMGFCAIDHYNNIAIDWCNRIFIRQQIEKAPGENSALSITQYEVANILRICTYTGLQYCLFVVAPFAFFPAVSAEAEDTMKQLRDFIVANQR